MENKLFCIRSQNVCLLQRNFALAFKSAEIIFFLLRLLLGMKSSLKNANVLRANVKALKYNFCTNELLFMMRPETCIKKVNSQFSFHANLKVVQLSHMHNISHSIFTGFREISLCYGLIRAKITLRKSSDA